MDNKAFFDYLRNKKALWSGKPKSRLTQSEVDEANVVLSGKDKVDEGEPQIKPAPDTGLASKKGPLSGVVGSVAATLLLAVVPQFEGTRYTAYKDIAGIWTVCQGDTKGVHAGLIETPEGCRQRLELQLLAHASGVMQCTPRLKLEGHEYQRAAAVSLAYNIGVASYCKSSVDKNFDNGNWVQGCNSFMAWNKARVNGQLRPVQGLTTRRTMERDICLKGLT